MEKHDQQIEKTCEFCNKTFIVTWKYRKQRFCNTICKCEYIKSTKRETVLCLNCQQPFVRYKNGIDKRTGKLKQYCSNNCNLSSNEKKEKLSIAFSGNKNPFANPEVVKKIRKTKLERYGNKNYNNPNPKKVKETLHERYNIDSGYFRKSNNKRISTIQKEVFKYVKFKYSDAELEKYLTDVMISVDMFIPSTKTIIETNGDYWHMNPQTYAETDYNKSVHKTAKEIWDKDEKRNQVLLDAGYKIITIWESEIDKGEYFNKIM